MNFTRARTGTKNHTTTWTRSQQQQRQKVLYFLFFLSFPFSLLLLFKTSELNVFLEANWRPPQVETKKAAAAAIYLISFLLIIVCQKIDKHNNNHNKVLGQFIHTLSESEREREAWKRFQEELDEHQLTKCLALVILNWMDFLSHKMIMELRELKNRVRNLYPPKITMFLQRNISLEWIVVKQNRRQQLNTRTCELNHMVAIHWTH